MKVAMIAPFEESVPPRKYGGTELVVYNIITELVAMGHDVTLFGTGDSSVPCKVIPIFPKSIRMDEPYIKDQKLRDIAKYWGVGKILKILQTEHYDIVHNHIGWRFLLFPDFISTPMVTTLHGPMSLTYQYQGFQANPEYQFVSISDNQRRDLPDLHYAATVYNGLDVTLFPTSFEPGGYLMFLGRMSPEKGVKEAIEVALQTGEKLLIAAKIDAVDQNYWREVEPMVDGNQIKFIGEIGFDEKVKYLKDAKALLAPIQWEEPFGLYVIEAMSCGTPVLGMKRGSFPELITPGIDGFLSTSVDEMAAQVKELEHIDRKACRKTVETRFTKSVMTKGYLDVYTRILAG